VFSGVVEAVQTSGAGLCVVLALATDDC